jgi:hypothetical protein
MRAARLAACLAALAHLTCHQVILTAPPGSTLALFANPEFIPAFGGVSVISALVTEPAGTPVPDGTVVQFFTNLGRVDEQGKTNDGVARVNLVSDSRSGTATVRAFSGGPATAPSTGASPGTGGGTGGSGASNSVTVVIGSALPARVQVTAFPTRVTSPRESLIRAFVVDANGNPVFNIPVIFTIEQPTGAQPTELMDSRGTPVYTDNNGVAEDRLLVRYAETATAKTVTVRVTVSFDSSKTATVAVTIN